MKTLIYPGVIAATLLTAGAAQACNGCYMKVTAPAVYQTHQQHYVVRPAQTHYSKIPAQYQTVQRQVMVRPAQKIAHHVPAVTQTVAETVMIAPASKVWSVTRDAHGREVGCWVKRPAQYATRHRTVIVRPASVSYSVIPAQYRTYTEQVQVRPAQLVAQTTPAVVATRNVTHMVAPATTSWQPIGHRGHHRHHGHHRGHRHH